MSSAASFSDTVNTGIYVLEPSIFDYYEGGRPVDFSQDVFPQLLANNDALYGYVAGGYWCDVGNIPEFLRANHDLLSGRVNLEPIGRNTAPCLALAALTIAERAPAATFVSLPADHTIGDPARFRATLTDAFGWAKRSGASVTLGIVPTAPETGYGYIRVGEPLGGRAFRVRAFVEKPARANARRFVASGEYLWNSGMFAWRVDVLLALFDAHLPALCAALRPAMCHAGRRRMAAIARAYRRVTPISIDYGIMEKTKDAIVIRADFAWSDVGSWAALADVASDRRGRTQAPVVAVDAARYVVFSPERLVALVGVDDVIVVDAPDAVLICRRDRAQDVRRVVDELRRRRLDTYL